MPKDKENNEYEREIWEKTTIIKDMVHGYIKIPKPIVKEIIDSEQFQRLKDIEQTGMEALYPSATHKRFTHSLGVYHLAKKAFGQFRNNISVSYPDIYKALANKKIRNAEEVWGRWELLFQLAALLHDCGHSPFSHTLEFVYDLPGDEDGKELNKKLLCGMDENFLIDFKRDLENDKAGKPHERMSALYIKTDDYSGLRSKVEKLLKSFVKAYWYVNIYDVDGVLEDDIEFMVRMIIGCRYDYDRKDDYRQKDRYEEEKQENWYIELQLRNCVIGMLNSQLDVDNLDYVVRDSKFSGYANHAVDLERLLSSFTIVKAFQVCDLPVTTADKFDYCINLEKFVGQSLNGRLTGASHIFCENKNIEAHGRIVLRNQKEKAYGDQRIYQTTDDFSAELHFDGNENASIAITAPKEKKRNCAYIHFKGEMSGTLTGIVFANEHREKGSVNAWCSKGELRIYFAYEQKCMSVLMSAVYNSNFEKKWIYSHHISTFTNDFLYIYLLEKYAEYVTKKKREEMIGDLDKLIADTQYQSIPDIDICEINDSRMTELKNNLCPEKEDDKLYEKIREINKDGLVVTNNIVRELMQLCNELNEQADTYREKFYLILKECCLGTMSPKCFSDTTIKKAKEIIDRYKSLLTAEMQVFSDILAMYAVYDVDGMIFYKASDRDLLAAYKNLYVKIKSHPDNYGREYDEFCESYEELTERKYLKCLWKSQPEFEYYFSDWTKKERELLRAHLKSHIATPNFDYMVLSDNITHKSEFREKLWNYLKEEFCFERFVCVSQQIRTKKFVDYEMYMKRGDRVLRLKDVKLFNDDSQDLDFFYFYYKQSKQVNIDVFEILDWLKKTIMEENADDH